MRLITIAGWLLAGTTLAHAATVAIGSASAASATGTDTIYATDPQDAANKLAFRTAVSLIQQGQPQFALMMLDKLVTQLEARYASPGKQVFCAHSPNEALAYMVNATADQHDAVTVDAEFCDTYFFRGYADVELGKLPAAQADFERAIALAPRYPRYLSEMGALHARRHEWPEALAFYGRAQEAAPAFAATGRANAELGVALRGIGYVDVELGKLDEAEAAYRHCLQIDPNDQKARAELGYVASVRAKSSTGL